MDLMPRWVVHDVPHRDVVLGLQDLNYLVAVFGHLDVDRLVLSFERHGLSRAEGSRERKREARARPPDEITSKQALEPINLDTLRFYSEDTSCMVPDKYLLLTNRQLAWRPRPRDPRLVRLYEWAEGPGA